MAQSKAKAEEITQARSSTDTDVQDQNQQGKKEI
jgi:hypothetical protein